MSSEAVTVSIRREVDPDHIPEVTAWVQAGVNLANRYPGFLGSGWICADADSHVWHMLYRFASADTLDAWENSAERAWWLSTGRGFVRSERTTRRTGIEGWFDGPGTTTVTVVDDKTAPPRWKQATTIWLGFFPVNLVFSYIIGLLPGWDIAPVWLRVLLTTLVLTPIMAYWVLPFVTRSLHSWLAR